MFYLNFFIVVTKCKGFCERLGSFVMAKPNLYTFCYILKMILLFMPMFSTFYSRFLTCVHVFVLCVLNVPYSGELEPVILYIK